MDAKDTYACQWVGGEGGNPDNIGGPGSVIVGVVGRTGVSGNIWALGAVSMRLEGAAAQKKEPPVRPGTPQPGLTATNVPGNIFTFIDGEVKANRVKHEQRGWTVFKQIKDMPEEPSILIGFNVLKKKGPFDHLIAGLQPMYLTRTGEKTGPWLGNPASEPIVLKAKPGYIVSALHIKTASTFDAFAVTFVRFEGGHILASDNYTSPWIGGSDGKIATVGQPGDLIVGVSGHVNNGGDLNAVGALSIRTPE
jgi:hypothetical protein